MAINLQKDQKLLMDAISLFTKRGHVMNIVETQVDGMCVLCVTGSNDLEFDTVGFIGHMRDKRGNL